MIRSNDPMIAGLAVMTDNPRTYLVVALEREAARLNVAEGDLLNAAWTVECVAQDIDAQSGQ